MNRSLTHTTFYIESPHRSLLFWIMIGWIIFTKMIKITPHFCDHPSDLVWLPTYFLWVYWYSFVKSYCAVTFWNHGWNGRNLEVTQTASAQDIGKDELKCLVPARPDILRGTTGLYPLRPDLIGRRRSSVTPSSQEK